MTHEIIGLNAGKVWEALNENGKLTSAKLVKITELKKDEIMLALGWLFKEDKIGTDFSTRTVKFFLK